MLNLNTRHEVIAAVPTLEFIRLSWLRRQTGKPTSVIISEAISAAFRAAGGPDAGVTDDIMHVMTVSETAELAGVPYAVAFRAKRTRRLICDDAGRVLRASAEAWARARAAGSLGSVWLTVADAADAAGVSDDVIWAANLITQTGPDDHTVYVLRASFDVWKAAR